MSKNGKVMNADLAPGRDLEEEFGNLVHPEQWKKYPIAQTPNENWSMMNIILGFEGLYMVQTWSADYHGVVAAKQWRDAVPDRKIFIRKVLEQITEIQEEM